MNPNSCLFSFFQLFFTLNIYKLQNFSISIRKEKKRIGTQFILLQQIFWRILVTAGMWNSALEFKRLNEIQADTVLF